MQLRSMNAAEGNENRDNGVVVDNLCKTFFPNTVREKRALDGVSFRLKEGEFTIIIGSNGAGKSTTLNAIAGEVPLDRGHIRVAGMVLDGMPPHRRARSVARVFQDPLSGTAASLSIEENLAIAARRGLPRSLRMGLSGNDRTAFKAALAPLGLGLENRLNDRVDLLSGGQRQSLALVMATLKRPPLLLLDEHTAALDPRSAKLVMEATLKAVESGRMTTIMITHNMDQAIAHGDRLLMMHEGRVILDLDREEKSKLTTADLVDRFHDVVSDRMLLT